MPDISHWTFNFVDKMKILLSWPRVYGPVLSLLCATCLGTSAVDPALGQVISSRGQGVNRCSNIL